MVKMAITLDDSGLAVVKEMYPELMARLELPRYAAPGGFRSYRDLTLHFMFRSVIEFHQEIKWGDQFSEEEVAIFERLKHIKYGVAMQFATESFPLYWTGPELVDAARKTEPPDWLALADVKWPREVIAFMLPQGSATYGTTEYEALIIARHKAGEPIGLEKDEWDGKTLVRGVPEGDDDLFAIIGLLYHTDTKLHSVNAATFGFSGTVGEFFKSEPERLSESQPDEMLEAGRVMPNVALNLLLILQARPELVEERVAIKKVKAAGGGRETLWSPRWLGRRYRLPSAPAQGGSHASPRMHWRNGHWRDQAYGPGWSQHRAIWIEPTLVNAEPKGTESDFLVPDSETTN